MTPETKIQRLHEAAAAWEAAIAPARLSTKDKNRLTYPVAVKLAMAAYSKLA